jgi:hypothetical protein
MRSAYVAAAFDDWRKADECRSVLGGAGYELLGDWTEHARMAFEQDGSASTAEHRGELSPAYQVAAAHSLMFCASSCDLLVLRCAPNFHKAFGAIGEFFIAVDRGAECHVITPPRHSIVFSLANVHVFESFDAWKTYVELRSG